MLDKIMQIVGGDALNEIIGKTGIPMDQARQMLPLAQDSLKEGLMPEVTRGNMEGLLGLFNSAGGSGLMNNAIFGSIKGLFIKKIMANLGLPESTAGLAAGSGMTSIIGGLAAMMRKDGDNKGIDATNIMNVLGVGGGAAGLMGGLMGQSAKGGEGIADSVMGAAGDLLGGNSNETKQGRGLLGGLKDAVGNIFGK